MIKLNLTIISLMSLYSANAAEAPNLGNPKKIIAVEIPKEIQPGKDNVNYEEIIAIFKSLDSGGVYTLKNYTVETVEKVKWIYLSKSKVTNAQLDKLSYLPEVLCLNLGATKLTPACLPSIARMKSARMVDVCLINRLFNAETLCETFKDHKNLEFVSLNRDFEKEMSSDTYKKFLTMHPGVKVLTDYTKTRYDQKIITGELFVKWLAEGLISESEAARHKGEADHYRKQKEQAESAKKVPSVK